MTHAEAIDKVRKLLALGKGTPYQAEAETALGLAQKILLEHGLSLAQVETDTDRFSPGADRFYADKLWRGARAPSVFHFVHSIVEDFFFCQTILNRDYTSDPPETEVFLCGLREHVPMGRHVFEYLTRLYMALWPPYKRAKKLREGERSTFWLGMNLGLGGKLKRERDAILAEQSGREPHALAYRQQGLQIISRDVCRFIREHFGAYESRSVSIGSNLDTLADGMARGNLIDLRKPLPAPRRQHALTAEVGSQRSEVRNL